MQRRSRLTSCARTERRGRRIENLRGHEKDGGDHQLAVQIYNLHYPMFGVSMTSKIEIGWTLKRADTSAVVWQEMITTEHTTGGTGAFVGVAHLTNKGQSRIAGDSENFWAIRI